MTSRPEYYFQYLRGEVFHTVLRGLKFFIVRLFSMDFYSVSVLRVLKDIFRHTSLLLAAFPEPHQFDGMLGPLGHFLITHSLGKIPQGH